MITEKICHSANFSCYLEYTPSYFKIYHLSRNDELLMKILTHLAYRANGNKLWYIGQ